MLLLLLIHYAILTSFLESLVAREPLQVQAVLRRDHSAEGAQLP